MTGCRLHVGIYGMGQLVVALLLTLHLSSRLVFSRYPSDYICPTYALDGSKPSCSTEDLHSFLRRRCNMTKKDPDRKKPGSSIALLLLPGVHKITIPIPKRVPIESNRSSNSSFYASQYWKCRKPMDFYGHDPAKTIVLLEPDVSDSLNASFENIPGNARVVAIAFRNSQEMTFENITFRSKILHAVYALVFLKSDLRIELRNCQFPDLTPFQGGIAVESLTSIRAPEQKTIYFVVIIQSCSFNIACEVRNPGQDLAELSQTAIRVRTMDFESSAISGKTRFKFKVVIRNCSIAIFETFINERNQRNSTSVIGYDKTTLTHR